jgi:Bifunctional DNA primase/polymerase, N-terminal
VSAEPGYAFQAGRILAGLHYKIVPIGAGQKYPPIQAWQEAATDNLTQVAAWLAETNYGIGWAMGHQPNGKHLFCLDIDGDLGAESLGQLILEHGSTDTFTATCQQQTGSGGWHYIFESEVEVRNSASQFAPGVDIRGEGGQIVVGPTIHPNGNAYRWVKGPKRNPPQLAPAWVMERIAEMFRVAPSPALPVAKLGFRLDNPSFEGETPFDWLNRTFDSRQALIRLGWTEGQRGQFTRPGKDPRHGTSATFHADTGVVNVFSTSVDSIYSLVGKAGKGCVILTPADLWMVENGLVDRSLASSMARHSMDFSQGSGAAAKTAPDAAVQEADTRQDVAVGFNLPNEFWLERGWLTQVRDAAHHRMLNPTSVLGAVMVRIAALVDPRVQLPDIIGSTGTFDLFVTLVGDSGSGKSTSWSCAKDLIPDLGPMVVDDLPLGTGEGLVERLYARVDEDGNLTRKGERQLYYKGVCIMVNEGKGINEQAARTGSIIIETLCQAWMGETLGQSNASEDTFRHVPPKRARIGACLSIQTGNAKLIFQDKFKITGFPQRMVALWAHPDWLPEEDDEPEWPGPLRIARPAVIGGTTTVFTVDPDIRRAVRRERRGASLRTVQLDELDTHIRLAQLKLAGIFAVADGTTHISNDHWALANTVLDSHRRLRSHIFQVHAEAEKAKRVTDATGRAETVMVQEDHIDKVMVARCVKSIRTQLDRQGTWTEGKLKNRLGERLKPHFEAALEILEVGGDIHRDGTTLTKT